MYSFFVLLSCLLCSEALNTNIKLYTYYNSGINRGYRSYNLGSNTVLSTNSVTLQRAPGLVSNKDNQGNAWIHVNTGKDYYKYSVFATTASSTVTNTINGCPGSGKMTIDTNNDIGWIVSSTSLYMIYNYTTVDPKNCTLVANVTNESSICWRKADGKIYKLDTVANTVKELNTTDGSLMSELLTVNVTANMLTIFSAGGLGFSNDGDYVYFVASENNNTNTYKTIEVVLSTNSLTSTLPSWVSPTPIEMIFAYEANDYFTSSPLSTGSISTGSISTGAITTGAITTGAITTSPLTTSPLTTSLLYNTATRVCYFNTIVSPPYFGVRNYGESTDLFLTQLSAWQPISFSNKDSYSRIWLHINETHTATFDPFSYSFSNPVQNLNCTGITSGYITLDTENDTMWISANNNLYKIVDYTISPSKTCQLVTTASPTRVIGWRKSVRTLYGVDSATICVREIDISTGAFSTVIFNGTRFGLASLEAGISFSKDGNYLYVGGKVAGLFKPIDTLEYNIATDWLITSTPSSPSLSLLSTFDGTDFYTSGQFTTGEITTSFQTTGPITSAELTTSVLTTAPVTSAGLTTSFLTTDSLTTNPVTSAELTTSPVTTHERTSGAVTSLSITSGFVTTSTRLLDGTTTDTDKTTRMVIFLSILVPSFLVTMTIAAILIYISHRKVNRRVYIEMH